MRVGYALPVLHAKRARLHLSQRTPWEVYKTTLAMPPVVPASARDHAVPTGRYFEFRFVYYKQDGHASGHWAAASHRQSARGSRLEPSGGL